MTSAPVSSLSYPKAATDTLKIDRSFVREPETSGDNAAIVAAIIAMSKSLKLRVVCRRCRDRGTDGALFEQGCQPMQDFSPAAPGSDFHGLIRNAASASTGGTSATVHEPPMDSLQNSNGRHFGAIDSEVMGPPRPAPDADRSRAGSQQGEPGAERDRALKWATRFIGRDG
jgi:hypothetical protein